MKEDSLPEGVQPWEVHYMSQYYDNDPRGSGSVPIDVRAYVLAKTYEEALKKGREEIMPQIKKAHKSYIKEVKSHEKIQASPISLENLVVARDSSQDGRIGWISTQNLSKVNLSDKDYEFSVVIRRK